MPGPRRRDFVLRDNEDFAAPFAFPEPGGRPVKDIVLTNGSPVVTSATAAFTVADNGKKLAIVDGDGLVDGATMTYVDPVTVTMSANASASRVGVVGIVRALNCSAYTTVGAHVKWTPGKKSPIVLALDVDDSRNIVGIFWITKAQASVEAAMKDQTAATAKAHWDWLWTSSAGDKVAYDGLVTFQKGETHRG